VLALISADSLLGNELDYREIPAVSSRGRGESIPPFHVAQTTENDLPLLVAAVTLFRVILQRHLKGVDFHLAGTTT